jgi:hypothetical protein
VRSRAIISVLALVPVVFLACSTNDSNYASLCPNFQDQPTCPAPAGALCVGNNPPLGCAPTEERCTMLAERLRAKVEPRD